MLYFLSYHLRKRCTVNLKLINVYIFNWEHKYGLSFRSSYRRTSVWKRHPSLCLNSKHSDKLFWSCNSNIVPCSKRDVLKGLKRTSRPFTYSSLLHSASRWKRPPPPSPNKTADSQPSFRNNLPLISAFFCLKNSAKYDLPFAMP